MKRTLHILFLLLLLSGCQCRQGSAPAVSGAEEETKAEPVFAAEPIPAAVEARMRGVSYPDDAEIPLSDLRYLRLTYVDFDGKEQVGEMVCNKAVADDLLAIFRALYEARYPIRSIRLLGLAVDVNPFENPYVRPTRVRPAGADAYADRTKDFPHKIDKNDLCYRLFREHGFSWGGAWRSVRDYQHFEK